MCGICGWAGRAPDAARLRAATRALAHRGPDQDGEWLGAGAMLGHRRLSILDLSPAGCQPMASEAGTIQLVFNGEIYNFAALRAQLERRHAFRSHTDSEVLIHGYEEWGIEGLLERLSGMFAFALWDGERQVLHLARDRMGKKPLFYASLPGGGLAFASTLPALLALRPEAPELEPDAVPDFLHHLCVTGERSMIRGVHKLLPAHRAEFSGGSLSVSRYWSVSFARQERRTEAEWLQAIDAEVQRAVADRLVSDVPVGIFLSGGVDSSLVAAVMARHTDRLVTISAGFEEKGFSELKHARRVARHLGAEHHEHVLRAEDAALLPWMVHAAGEPFGDHAVLPTMHLARAARRDVVVVLTGDGGDELFAGYSGPVLARLAAPYMKLPLPVRTRMVPLLQRLERRGGRAGGAARKLLRVALPARGPSFTWEYDVVGRRGFRGGMDGLFTAGFAARLEGPEPDAWWREMFAAADGPTYADRVLQTELTTLLPDQFLVKTDVATMAYGIEARSPLLDAKLVELAARIPIGQKVPGGRPKYLLKRLAARYVPPEVLYRPKQGFSVPTSAWMRGPLGRVAEEVLLSEASLNRGIFRPERIRTLVQDHRAGRADHGQRMWLLLVLELWHRAILDGTLSPGDQLDIVPVRAVAAA